MRRLALELAMAGEPRRIEAAVLHRRANVAAGLALVSAVPELAAVGELGDVAKVVSRPSVGAGDARASGCLGVSMSSAPAGQPDELAVGGRMAAARVVVADVAGRWRSSPSSALTSVDLPTPDEPSTTAVRPGAGGRRRGRRRRSPVSAEMIRDRDAGRDRLGGDAQAFEIVGHVGLVEHDDGRRAAGPRDREVALEATEVEVAVEARARRARRRRWRP